MGQEFGRELVQEPRRGHLNTGMDMERHRSLEGCKSLGGAGALEGVCIWEGAGVWEGARAWGFKRWRRGIDLGGDRGTEGD